MPKNKLKSLAFIWIAIISIAFTTISIYTLNSKSTLTEISEEMNEDGADTGEDGDDLLDFNPLLNVNSLSLSIHSNSSCQLACNKLFSLSLGFSTDLIKPPLN